ncbi:uncharacterized protein LOC114733786 [Neltuma alba]|uniref:uncharacterized protein LOC114733786 n=1 Tax=Neltuma alba TaxID=207710 RepID=UPI0010A47E0D|nr:uncharacterized protein LOC114733786 [Prosopis alba]
MMASKFAHSLVVLVLIASMFGASVANKDWFPGFNYTDWWSRSFGHQKPNMTRPQSNKIIVGGSENWHFGFNYSDWAIKNGPFYLNDTLVFKYDAPNATTHPHSVYMFSDYWSFLKCDLTEGKCDLKCGELNAGCGRGIPDCVKEVEAILLCLWREK